MEPARGLQMPQCPATQAPGLGSGEERMEASLRLHSFPQWASAPCQVGTGASETRKALSALLELSGGWGREWQRGPG